MLDRHVTDVLGMSIRHHSPPQPLLQEIMTTTAYRSLSSTDQCDPSHRPQLDSIYRTTSESFCTDMDEHPISPSIAPQGLISRVSATLAAVLPSPPPHIPSRLLPDSPFILASASPSEPSSPSSVSFFSSSLAKPSHPPHPPPLDLSSTPASIEVNLPLDATASSPLLSANAELNPSLLSSSTQSSDPTTSPEVFGIRRALRATRKYLGFSPSTPSEEDTKIVTTTPSNETLDMSPSIPSTKTDVIDSLIANRSPAAAAALGISIAPGAGKGGGTGIGAGMGEEEGPTNLIGNLTSELDPESLGIRTMPALRSQERRCRDDRGKRGKEDSDDEEECENKSPGQVQGWWGYLTPSTWKRWLRRRGNGGDGGNQSDGSTNSSEDVLTSDAGAAQLTVDESHTLIGDKNENATNPEDLDKVVESLLAEDDDDDDAILTPKEEADRLAAAERASFMDESGDVLTGNGGRPMPPAFGTSDHLQGGIKRRGVDGTRLATIQRAFDIFQELDSDNDDTLGVDDLEKGLNMFDPQRKFSRQEVERSKFMHNFLTTNSLLNTTCTYLVLIFISVFRSPLC